MFFGRVVSAVLVLLTAVSAFAPLPSAAPRRPMVAPLQMANSAAAKKRIRTSERNRVINSSWRSRVRTWTRKTNEAIAEGKVEEARECARVTTSMIDRATRRNIYHKNWAARNKSRLSKKVIALIMEKKNPAPAAAPAEAA